MADTLISASEVWLAVKDHIDDEKQAAIDVVNALIDNQGHNADEILDSDLGQDKNIKNALSAYVVEEEEDDDGLDTWGDEVDDGSYNDDEDDNY